MPTPTRALAPIALALAACSPPPPVAAPPVAAASAPLTLAPGVCDSSVTTWLAVTPLGLCPSSIGSWTGAALFPGSGVPLDRFCRYDDTGGADPQDLIDAGLLDVGPDCGIVVPQADLGDTEGQLWNDAFLGRLGLVSPGQGAAQVIVLDTAGPGGSPSKHGPAMVALAGQIATPARVTPQIALPRNGNGVADWMSGGHYGTLSDLAIALVDATDASGRLVLNLSLGWPATEMLGDGTFPAGHYDHLILDPDTVGVPAPVQAVHAALVRAVCAEALIIASAGNDPIGRRDSGALMPARWALLPAPEETDCIDLGFAGDGADSPDRGLVEPVGGVDLADRRLDNSRPDSLPRLVAPAEHITAALGEDWVQLSGTSVSAVAVSAAAAVVWSHAPTLTADEVADALYDGAVSLETIHGVAELCHPDGCEQTARLSVCGALGQITTVEDCVPPLTGDPSALNGVMAQITAREGPTVSATTLSMTPVLCGPDSECPPALDAPPAVTSAPVSPQPTWPACPSCVLYIVDQVLTLDIPTDAPVLEDPLLVMNAPSGQWNVDLSPIVSTLYPGDYVKFEGVPVPPGVETAWMNFTIQGTTTLSKGNPIQVH